MSDDIEIEWGESLPATIHGPDLKRTSLIWVNRGGARIGGAFVSTTGFTEIVMNLDDRAWEEAVEQAVRSGLSRAAGTGFALLPEPSPDDHYVYVGPGEWAHRPSAKGRAQSEPDAHTEVLR